MAWLFLVGFSYPLESDFVLESGRFFPILIILAATKRATMSAMTDNPMVRLGFAGLGTMGSYMAANLARAGYPLTVWNRTPGRAQELLELGAREASTPADLARSSDIIFLCVTDSPQVESILFGPNGVSEGIQSGSLVIDCSTISPTRAREFADKLDAIGVGMLDAPVSGGSERARLATLTIMVGGELEHFERASAVLSNIGRTISHLGPLVRAVGQGRQPDYSCGYVPRCRRRCHPRNQGGSGRS